MADGTVARSSRGHRTICLPIAEDSYARASSTTRPRSAAARRGLPRLPPSCSPGLRPRATASRTTAPPPSSACRMRRVRLKATGESFSVRPSFVLPYMAGSRRRRRRARCSCALRRPVLGPGPRLRQGPDVLVPPGGRPGPQQRRRHHRPPGRAARAPAGRRAPPDARRREELRRHHRRRRAAAWAPPWPQTAGAEDLQAAYGVFKAEARDVQPDYRPQTVSVDGWASTHQAWLALFPLVVLLRCFLHGWLNIRSRGKLSEAFAGAVGEGVGGVPRADPPGLRAAAAAAVGVGAGGRGCRRGCWSRSRSCAAGRRSTARRTRTPAGTGRATCWTG